MARKSIKTETILDFICDHPGYTKNEISFALDYDLKSVYGILTKLEKRGFIRRFERRKFKCFYNKVWYFPVYSDRKIKYF